MKQYESFQSWGYPKFAGWFMSGSIHFRKMGDVFLGYPHDELETPWNLRPRGPGTSWAFLEVHQASFQARFPPPAHLRLGVVRQKMMPLEYDILCYVLLCSVVFFYVMLYHVMLCMHVCTNANNAIQCNVCDVMGWDVQSCNVMSCHATSSNVCLCVCIQRARVRERKKKRDRRKPKKREKNKKEEKERKNDREQKESKKNHSSSYDISH